MEKKSKSEKIMVAAIDFGTTYSGYAFSLKDDWRKVLMCKWSGGTLSHKAPTSLLLKKDRSEALFGYGAEDKYSELTSENKHHGYFFFQRFKMILHQDFTVKRHITCNDITGQPLEAGVVFEQCIRCLKKPLLQQLKKLKGIHDNDIEYVLTVPAIWGDKAKLFMREAAVKAGIRGENLTIVLEPEAASIYCQYLKFSEEDTSSQVLGVVKPGTKYMLVHLGDARANITVHQKNEDNTLEEVFPTSGGPWGGKSVDDQFIKFLSELVGKTVWEQFMKEDIVYYLDIIESMKTKKSTTIPEKKGYSRIKLPNILITLATKYHGVKTFKEVIQKNYAYKDIVDITCGKLVWNNDFFRGFFFKKTIDGIVKHIDEILQESGAKDVRIIVMVGGFSGCLLVQDAIKKNFGNLSIIVPEEGDLAVLKGAVYFGHIPDAIPRRSARYTYGFQTWPEFNEDIHPEEKRVQSGKLSRCRDVFLKIVTKGDKITAGFTKSQVFRVPYNRENVLECGLFISEKRNPKFVDDPDCKLLGTLQVPLSPNKQNSETLVEEKLLFDMTELKFTAEDIFSGLKYEISFDLHKE